MLEKFFKFKEHRTTLQTEILAGCTTFLAMAYILFVQPAVLSKDFAGNPTGLDFGAILLATCIASAAASIFMGLYARYPIALAPGMGENFFFISVVMSLAGLGFPEPWRVALGIVFLSGILFIGVSLSGLRATLVNALSPSLRSGIAVGIGLFIALIGLRNAGIIMIKPGSGLGLNAHLNSVDTAIFVLTFLVSIALYVRRVPGALILGIIAGTVSALLLKRIEWSGHFFGFPSINQSALFALDIRSALSLKCLPYILVFFFMVLFDTTGTLIAVAEHAGFMRGNELPRAKEAFLVDAVATTGGALFGTSTVTSFIESIAGVQQGGRTGFTAVVTGLLFIAALFFSPLVALVGQHPGLTAPALVLVGALMAENVTKIQWTDLSESLPSFLILLGIPMTYSIADGIALGLVCYPVMKFLCGKAGEIKKSMFVLSLILLAYFIWIRPGV